MGQSPGNDDPRANSHTCYQYLPAGGPTAQFPILRQSYQKGTAPGPQDGPQVDEEEGKVDHVSSRHCGDRVTNVWGTTLDCHTKHEVTINKIHE